MFIKVLCNNVGLLLVAKRRKPWVTLDILIVMVAINATIPELTAKCSPLEYIEMYGNYCTFK